MILILNYLEYEDKYVIILLKNILKLSGWTFEIVTHGLSK